MSGQFSAFAPFGVFRFSAKPSPCKQRYDELQTSLGPALRGPVQDALNYGIGVAFGVAQLQLEAAAAQSDPQQTTYLLADLERDYQLKPLPYDSENVRRAALAAVMDVGRGATRAEIESGLSAILGDLFVGCRWLDAETEAVTFPTMRGYFVPPGNPIRHVRITDRILPGERTVHYTPILTDGIPLRVGDWLVVDPGQYGLEERIDVRAATATTFTASYAYVHEPGARATTAPWPHWGSTKRHTVVVVNSSVLFNRRQLSQAEWFMRRKMTGVSTWVFCAGTLEYPTYFQIASDRAIGYAPIQGLEP